MTQILEKGVILIFMSWIVYPKASYEVKRLGSCLQSSVRNPTIVEMEKPLWCGTFSYSLKNDGFQCQGQVPL